MRQEQTGYGCLICGKFLFIESDLQDEWSQFRQDAQYSGGSGLWPGEEYPVARTWALMEYDEPVFPELFKEFAHVSEE